ncbi:MAG TPA: ABC transporter permease [Methanobacteriales archaeon]|nr:MAG: Binding-protein-dependent transport systems inner membrane component [Methanobacteriaceae archaeon 41_258]HIH61841.1 ABC transporter permease [Methanobacteriales archaeon]
MKKFLEALIIPVILLIIWSMLTFTNLVPSYILPSPYEVLIAFYNLLVTGELFLHAMSTLSRVVAGFSAAAMISIPLGIGIGWSKTLERLFNPIIQILRPIPPLAWVPFALLWFGLGLKAEAFIIFIGSFFPILLNSLDAVKGVERVLIEAACTLGATEGQVLIKVVLPASSPGILLGLRVGFGIGFMCTVAAEMIAAKSGLGYLIMEAMRLLDTGEVVVGMLTIGLIGFAIDYLLLKVEERYIPWRGKTI